VRRHFGLNTTTIPALLDAYGVAAASS